MKIVKILITLLLCLILLCSCNTQMQSVKDEIEQSNLSMFVLIENGDGYKIVYHRETKVMYAISDGIYNLGTFTVLLDADGTPMLYPELPEENEDRE